MSKGRIWDPEATRGRIMPRLGVEGGVPDYAEEYKEWLRPMLMSQRRALLMQVEAIEKVLGIEPTTADLRRKQKSSIMGTEG